VVKIMVVTVVDVFVTLPVEFEDGIEVVKVLVVVKANVVLLLSFEDEFQGKELVVLKSVDVAVVDVLLTLPVEFEDRVKVVKVLVVVKAIVVVLLAFEDEFQG
jgi:Zn-dependent membrane protease YugP